MVGTHQLAILRGYTCVESQSFTIHPWLSEYREQLKITVYFSKCIAPLMVMASLLISFF